MDEIYILCYSMKEAHRLYKRAVKELCFEIKHARETPIYTIEFDGVRFYFIDQYSWENKYQYGRIGVRTSYGHIFEMMLDSCIKKREIGD